MLNPFEIEKEDQPLFATVFGVTLLVLCLAAFVPLLGVLGSDDGDVLSYIFGAGLILLLLVPTVSFFVFFVIKLVLLFFHPFIALAAWFKEKEKLKQERMAAETAAQLQSARRDEEATRAHKAAAVQSERDEADRQKRRKKQDVRARCELLYNLHAPEIGQRFQRSMFDAFVTTYLPDSCELEDVERRGIELQATIEGHRANVQEKQSPRTISEISEWYLSEKTRISNLGVEEELRQTFLIQLDQRYLELSQSLLESAQP